MVARSTFGCVPTAPHGAGGDHRCRRHPAADSRRWPTTPTPRSVRTVCTRVRGTGRGFGAQDGVATPVQWGKTPDRAPNPRPEGHDGRLSEEASPGLTHGLTRVTPRPPHVRTRARVADVPPGRVGNPKARPQPSDTSATRRVPRAGGREGWRASPRGRRGWDREAWVGLIWPLTSSRRYWRYRNGNPPSGQHDVSGVPAARSVSQDAGLPCHCNGNPVSDQHGMSGDELGTNRLEPRGNPAIPTKTRPRTNAKRPICPCRGLGAQDGARPQARRRPGER